MPANLVKTPKDEKLWSKAKAIAAKEGHKEDWAYINSIYQNMKGGEKKSSLAQKLAQELRPTHPSATPRNDFVISPGTYGNYNRRARAAGEGFMYPYNPNYRPDTQSIATHAILSALTGGLYNPTQSPASSAPIPSVDDAMQALRRMGLPSVDRKFYQPTPQKPTERGESYNTNAPDWRNANQYKKSSRGDTMNKEAGEVRGIPDATGPYGRGMGPGGGTRSGLGLLGHLKAMWDADAPGGVLAPGFRDENEAQIAEALRGLDKENIMRMLVELMMGDEEPVEVKSAGVIADFQNRMLNASWQHEDNEKVAGMLDTIARKAPMSLRPMLQKLIVMFKYPELHAQLAGAKSIRKLVDKKRSDIIKDLLEKNRALFKRNLDTQSLLYKGHNLDDLIMREAEVPTLARMLREGDDLMRGLGM